MISQVIIMALFTLQYGIEELEAYVIILCHFPFMDRNFRLNLNSIIILGFPHKFFLLFYFYLKMNTFF